VHVVIEKPFGTTWQRPGPSKLAGADGIRGVHRSFGSITTSARRPCRTFWLSDSANFRSLSRSGIAPRSPASRSPWRSKSALARERAFYDSIGAYRDMVPSHMLQLLCLLCWKPPATSRGFDRDEKAKLLKPSAARADDAVCAVYTSGNSRCSTVPGYLEEPGVPPGSSTETFAARRLAVDNWRWAGVPFYLRTGKRLARKETEIAVTLRPVPHLAFRGRAEGVTPKPA